MNSQIFQYDGNPITFQIGEATVVNATQMAKPFGKRVQHFLSTDQTKEFLNVLSQSRNIGFADLVQVSKGGTNPGTWFHEDVALEFARWLSPQFAIWCNDRIKELMKYGMTATPQTIDNILADPDNAIKILTALKEERKRNKLLEEQKRVYHSENQRLLNIKNSQAKLIEKQTPKVEYADNVLSSTSTYTTTQIAKELEMSACKLNKLLHRHGVQYRQGGQWFLYEKYHDKGYMKTKTYTYDKKDGRVGTMLTSVWTEAGRMFVHSLVK
jgi:phage antirepressor YoqD-like protein